MKIKEKLLASKHLCVYNYGNNETTIFSPVAR